MPKPQNKLNFGILLLLSTIFFLPSLASADWSSYYNPPVVNGLINSIQVDTSTNTGYIGGYFSYVGKYTGGGKLVHISTVSTSSPQFTGTVNIAISDNAGGFYVGGNFNQVGSTTVNNLCHLRNDGTVDTSFNPNVNGPVSSLLLSGSTLYIGGTFSQVSATTRNNLAAYDTSGNSLTTFNPNVNGPVSSLLLSGSTLYIGGTFSQVSATTRNNLAAYDTSGNSLTTFNPNVNGPVYALESGSLGIMLGGSFSSVDGQTRNNLAVVSSLGHTTAFQEDANGTVYVIKNANKYNSATYITDTYFLGGSFSSINSQAATLIAKLNSAGNLDNSIFSPQITGSNIKTMIFESSDDGIYLGGSFSAIDGQTRLNVAFISSGLGQLPDYFNLQSDNSVNTICFGTNSNTFVGGDFSSIGYPAKNNVAAFNLTTGEPTTFSADTDDNVNVLLIHNNKLYIGGDFSNVAGEVRPEVAAINLTTGELDPNFNPWPDGSVYTLAATGTKIFLGGDFNTVKKSPSENSTRNYLAVFNTDGSLDESFDPNFNAAVKSLLITGNQLFVGGYFTQAGDTALNNLSSFNLDNWQLNTGFLPNLDGGVLTMAYNQNKLYLGGFFQNINGSTHTNLGVLDLQNNSAVADFPQTDDAVNAMLIDNHVLYLSGNISQLGTASRNYLAAFDLTNNQVSSFNPNLDDTANSLAIYGKKLIIGGNFNHLSNRNQKYLSIIDTPRLNFSNLSSLNPSSVNQNIQINLDAALPYDLAIGYQTSGTANYGTDYSLSNGAAGSLTIPAQSTSTNLVITIPANTSLDGNKNINLSLTTPVGSPYTNAILSPAAYTHTILNQQGASTSSAPTNLTVSQVSSNSATIQWQSHSTNEQFWLEQSTDGSHYSYISSAPATTSSLVVTNLRPDTKYWFRLAAYNETSITPFATTSSGKATLVATPQITSGSSYASVFFNWDDSTKDTNTYSIFYDNNTPKLVQLTAGDHSYYYTIDDLQCGTDYTVSITGINQDGASSSPVVIQQSTSPCQPTPSYAAAAQASEIVVVYNQSYSLDQDQDGVQDSLEIASYYKQKRNIPDNNIIGLTATSSEKIDRATYNSQIKSPLELELSNRHLASTTKYIILVKGIPLKISDTNPAINEKMVGLDITTPTSNQSSVDAAVCLLYQTYSLTGRINNPYFLPYGVRNQKNFLDKAYNFKTDYYKNTILSLNYLVTRLDAYTPSDVKKMIDRALIANNQASSSVFITEPFNFNGNPYGQQSSAQSVLKRYGFHTIPDPWNDNYGLATTSSRPVVAYTSGGTNSGLPPNYYTNSLANLTWSAGAITNTFESYNGHSFYLSPEPTLDGQGTLAQFISVGGSGGLGFTSEPRIDGAAQDSLLLPAYASGYNLAESAYMSLPFLDWTNIVIGDPLMNIGAAEVNNTTTVPIVPTPGPVSGSSGAMTNPTYFSPELTAINVPLKITSQMKGSLSKKIDGHQIDVAVPSGLVKTTTTFSIDNLNTNTSLPNSTTAKVLSIFNINAVDDNQNSVHNFNNNLTIKIGNLNFPANLKNVALYYFNESSSQWILVPDIQIDETNKTITFNINHLTKFAIFEVNDKTAILGAAPSSVKNPPIANSPLKTKDSFTFNNNLKLGAKHPDAKRLQIFLNSQGFYVSKTGAGSKNKETNLFGQLTKQALIKFQKSKLSKTLPPKKFPAILGLLEINTRKFINKIISK